MAEPDPTPEALLAVAAAHDAAGRPAEAARAYGALAGARLAHGDVAGALALYQAALARAPDDAILQANHGSALHAAGRYDAAVAALGTAFRLRPDLPPVRTALVTAIGDWGLHLQRQGQAEPAIGLYRQALALDPARVAIRTNLGGALLARDDVDGALAEFRAVAAAEPDGAAHQLNLGTALIRTGALDAAIAGFERALALDPASVEAALNLGTARLEQGDAPRAVEAWRRALALAPDRLAAHSNLLMGRTYDPATRPAELLAAARRLDALLAPLAAPRAPAAPRDPDRRLRIGYVSADFRRHPVGWFIQAPIVHHDTARFEVTCYASSTAADDVTERLQRHAARWRCIAGQPDDAVAATIAADGIDILIELAGHSAHNRLGVLARRPAPVQATWIGFPLTTGLGAVDALIADAALVPPGDEGAFSERIVRLPDVAWCYTPPADAPPVASRPADAPVTFGCFNNPAKLNPAVFAAWAAILDRIPGSRLLLKYRHLDGGETAARVRMLARAAGIADARLTLAGASPHVEALAAYGTVDVALDPFPFNGGTTTCEALWMGVPVVTRAGDRMAGRMGASFVAAAGLPELVARDADAYVAIAAGLAADAPRRADLRSRLRAMLAASPLGDARRFVTGYEAALRALWRDRGGGSGGDAS